MSRPNRVYSLFSRTTVLCAVVAASCFLSARDASATVILSDNFSTSTIPTGAYPTPTATSTGYAIAAAKAQSPAPSIATGHLQFGIAATTGGIEEAQALFTSTPITLSNIGDYVQMTFTFTNTGILASTATTTGQLSCGMYISGGNAPKTDLQASGLSSTLTADATGGAAGWQGYVSQVFQTGGSSPRVVTRPAQTGPDNTNQDLVTSGASSSQSYHNPAGTSLGTTGTDQTLATGTQYTEDYKITLTAAGTYQITSALYQGADTSGTLLSSQSDNATGANFYSGGFDGMAFGWRSTASVATLMDVNSLTVQTNVAAVPEPASLLLFGLGAAALATVYRRRAG